MKILVTGATGQLGNEIKTTTENKETSHHYIFTDENSLDITRNAEVEQFFRENKIDRVINCAAYTNVDGAEDDPENAYLLNEKAVDFLSKVVNQYNAQLIHVSTDYVFNGKSYTPYKESDTPNPESVYGKSKLEGEKKVLDNKSGIIIRTSWLYSSFGKNFVKTIARLADEREELKVVYDQVGSPTYARNLASAIVKIAESENKLPSAEVYHFSNEGVCSWYDLAMEIVNVLKLDCTIHPIESKDFPTKAKRPPYSVFNKQKIKDDYRLKIPHWKESLMDMLKKFNM